MREVRITSNGFKFRCEFLVSHKFLWWRWSKWVSMWKSDGHGRIIEAQYITEEAARIAMQNALRRDEEEASKWIPVDGEPSSKMGRGGRGR